MPRHPGRSFLAAVLAVGNASLAQSSEPPQASRSVAPEVAETARALFRDGAQLAAQSQWEQARDRFLRALALRSSPLLRFNLALAGQNSGHFVESIDQYRQFLLDDADPANAVRRQEAQTAITAMEHVVARIELALSGTDTPTSVRLDGRGLPASVLGEAFPVDPVDHYLEVVGASGAIASTWVRPGEGEHRIVRLVIDRLTSSAPPTAPASSSPPPPVRAASSGAIDRVRHLIEDLAHRADPWGQRRWERTFVVFAFAGLGNPVGVGGAGFRWAARPWIGFEMHAGIGNPFGPGIGLAVTGGTPVSYRYGLGLLVGVSTNFTEINAGMSTMGQHCDPSSSFTPVWLNTAIVQEWRATRELALRASIGARFLINNQQLAGALVDHCAATQPFDPTSLFFDTPTTDRRDAVVLPYLSLDGGYAM